jgi:hypothetical protein
MVLLFIFRRTYKSKLQPHRRKNINRKPHKKGFCSRKLRGYKKGYTTWDDVTMKKCKEKLNAYLATVKTPPPPSPSQPPQSTDTQNAEICTEARKQAVLMFGHDPRFSQWSFNKPIIWEHYDICGPL